MADLHYPSIDTSEFEAMLLASPKILPDSRIKVGDTVSFVIAGTQAMHKRAVILRELDPGQICLEIATGLAIRFGFLSKLMEWLEANKNWKEGAYIVPANNN